MLFTLWGDAVFWIYLLITFIALGKIIKSCASTTKRTASDTREIITIHAEEDCDAALSDGNVCGLSEDKDGKDYETAHNTEIIIPNPFITQSDDTENIKCCSKFEPFTLKSSHGQSDENSSNQESPNIEKQISDILYSFSINDQRDFINAIKKKPLYRQQQLVDQLKNSSLIKLSTAYLIYKMNGHSFPTSGASDEKYNSIIPLGITKTQNAIERYRDTDYFGATNRYDSPKWQEDHDDYEQCAYSTYFLG